MADVVTANNASTARSGSRSDPVQAGPNRGPRTNSVTVAMPSPATGYGQLRTTNIRNGDATPRRIRQNVPDSLSWLGTSTMLTVVLSVMVSATAPGTAYWRIWSPPR